MLLRKVTEVSDQGKKKKTIALFFQAKYISCFNLTLFFMRLSMLRPKA